jgi:hypothetical protein
MVQTDRQATDDNILRHVHFAFSIIKATNTHSKNAEIIFEFNTCHPVVQ